jgi:4'-phosphopantetheinyl transferase
MGHGMIGIQRREEAGKLDRRWVDPPENLVLGPGSVHLWFAPSGTVPIQFEPDVSVLSHDERKRALAFRFDLDRARYIRAHRMLRAVLSRYTGIPADALRFVQNDCGKPSLAEPSDVHFNMSDTLDAALLAVTLSGEVGVDIEKLRPVPDAADIASRYFTPVESEWIFSRDKTDRDKGFLQLWTRKEAVIKAEGKGLSLPLSAFDCSGVKVLVHIDREEELSRWRVLSVHCGLLYLAALATRWDEPHVEYFIFRET